MRLKLESRPVISCTPRVQEVHTKAEVVHLTPRGIIQLSRIRNVLRNMINPRISAVWSTTKKVAPFSCTRHVQEVHVQLLRLPSMWSCKLTVNDVLFYF